MDPSTVGLALSYALTLQTNLNRFVTMFSETETSLVSVERIMEYQNAPQEAPFSIPEQGKLGPSKTSKLMGHALLAIRVECPLKATLWFSDPPPEWPERGGIRFEGYQTRYREGLDLVLRGVDCDIRSGEKIGIVGR